MTTDMIVHPDAVDVQCDLDAQDLYEVLGVRKTATAAEIRRAFRKASMKYHPDRNDGTEESKAKIQKINEAYAVLSDFSSREFYDNTGRAKPSDSEIEAKARDLLDDVFGQAFDLAAANDHPLFEIKYYDPVADVIDSINNSIKGLQGERTKMQRAISRHENLRKRFTKKNSDFTGTPPDRILEMKIKKTKQRYSLMEMDMKVQQAALRFAHEYQCKPEPKPMSTSFTAHGREHPLAFFFNFNEGTTK